MEKRDKQIQRWSSTPTKRRNYQLEQLQFCKRRSRQDDCRKKQIWKYKAAASFVCPYSNLLNLISYNNSSELTGTGCHLQEMTSNIHQHADFIKSLPPPYSLSLKDSVPENDQLAFMCDRARRNEKEDSTDMQVLNSPQLNRKLYVCCGSDGRAWLCSD